MINAAGLKVVVDMHLIPAGGSRSIGMGQVMDDPEIFDRYVELVRTMAHALSKEDPALVAFEPMNEPVVDCDERRHQPLARPAAETVTPRRAPRRRG